MPWYHHRRLSALMGVTREISTIVQDLPVPSGQPGWPGGQAAAARARAGS